MHLQSGSLATGLSQVHISFGILFAGATHLWRTELDRFLLAKQYAQSAATAESVVNQQFFLSVRAIKPDRPGGTNTVA